MLDKITEWAMRRLLSLDRDAAKEFFNAPDDGKKWTISALVGLGAIKGDKTALKWEKFIDDLFWKNHCREAANDTLFNLPLELYTWRAKRGALRTVWAIITGKGKHLLKKD